jgi:hypothetical protein
MSYNGFKSHRSVYRVCLYFSFSLIANLMPWTLPPSLPNLLRVSIPVVHQYPKPEVHHVQGYVVLMSAVSEIVVARAPHEWVHVYEWNCLSLVPFLFSLYIHYFPDSHVFHGFPVIGCLQNDQQQKNSSSNSKGSPRALHAAGLPLPGSLPIPSPIFADALLWSQARCNLESLSW